MISIFFSPFTLILLLFLVLLSFFFSVSETSIIALSRIRLRHLLSRGIKRAQSVQRLISKLDKFIVTILVGNNFVNIAISAIVTGICVSILGYKKGVIIATFSTALFVVVLCEIAPKILAIKHPEKIALFIAPLMDFLIKIFSPFLAIFIVINNLIIKILRIKPVKKSPLITEEELRLMIELGREEGFLSDEEGKMLQRIFVFGDTKVSDVMIPKENIVAVDINSTPEELMNIFVEQGHARLPVYKDSVDNISGIIYARDLLYILRDKKLFVLQDLMQEIDYILADIPVNEVLKKFQNEKIQIAIVVDAHKKTLGLVTLEDLIEEIVGEIEEKHIKRQLKTKV